MHAKYGQNNQRYNHDKQRPNLSLFYNVPLFVCKVPYVADTNLLNIWKLKKYNNEEKKLYEYREQCKEQALELFLKWFHMLWN